MAIFRYEIEIESTDVVDASTKHGEEVAKERFERELSKTNIACCSMNFRCIKLTEVT